MARTSRVWISSRAARVLIHEYMDGELGAQKIAEWLGDASFRGETLTMETGTKLVAIDDAFIRSNRQWVLVGEDR